MTKEAFCVKCRVKRAMQNEREITNRRNVKMLQGDCGTCSKKINTFIKKAVGPPTVVVTKKVKFQKDPRSTEPAGTAARLPKKAGRRPKEDPPPPTSEDSS